MEELILEVGTNKTVNNVTDPLTTLDDEDYKGIVYRNITRTLNDEDYIETIRRKIMLTSKKKPIRFS